MIEGGDAQESSTLHFNSLFRDTSDMDVDLPEPTTMDFQDKDKDKDEDKDGDKDEDKAEDKDEDDVNYEVDG